MEQLEELEKMQQEQRENTDKEPMWIYYTDNGQKKVDAQKLSYEIMKEIPMIRASELSYGARFDKSIGAWRLDSLNDFLESYITGKLEKVGKWSQPKLAEVKRFIMIKIYDSKMKHNPFNQSQPHLANFKNGTYNLKTRMLKPHDIKDYILQSQDYAINPSNDKQPQKTLEWLTDLTSDEKSTLYLTELIGYCFYRSYEPFQCVTILQGTGKNGKSTFLNLLTKILGESNVSNITLDELGNKQNRFAKSNLYQKLANLFADIDAEFIKSTGLIKALTGGDRLSAEQKGKDAYMFVNFAKLIFSANELPPFNDFTEGFERRLYVVPFKRVVDESFKRKYDLRAIEEEIPVFAIYCMEKFIIALGRGYLTESESMKQAKEKWLKDSNHVLRFIEEICVVDKTSSEGDSSKMIYEEYKNFCFRESLRELSQPKFAKQLEKMGIYKRELRQKGVRAKRYIHLKIKNSYLDEQKYFSAINN